MDGRRTGALPTTSDSFVWRICKALDEPPRILAMKIGVPYHELAPMLDDRHKLVEIDRDEVWWKLSAYVKSQLAMLLAVQHELDKALQKDRADRVVRTAHERHAARKSLRDVRSATTKCSDV